MSGSLFSLPEGLRETIDVMLRARGWPTTSEPERLGAMVRSLSASYNQEGVAVAGGGHAARLGFFLVRDIPKSAWALRDLVRGGVWKAGDSVDLKVLDLGAGMGATTFGLMGCLAAHGIRGDVRATLVDADAGALNVAAELARKLSFEGLRLEVSTRVGDAHAYRPAAPVDLVLMGQVLSELDQRVPAEERVAAHVRSIAERLKSSVKPHGTLCIVEPALRGRTRHLHALRDALITGQAATVFSPCLHAGSCPALLREEDWCHDDVDVDVPDWLIPTARAAGLRYQGLTLSYLNLRRDERTLRSMFPTELRAARATSGAIVSKGKCEGVLCGDIDAGEHRARLRLLDKEQTEHNVAWLNLRHGDVVTFEGEPPLKGRIARDTKVHVQ